MLAFLFAKLGPVLFRTSIEFACMMGVNVNIMIEKPVISATRTLGHTKAIRDIAFQILLNDISLDGQVLALMMQNNAQV